MASSHQCLPDGHSAARIRFLPVRRRSQNPRLRLVPQQSAEVTAIERLRVPAQIPGISNGPTASVAKRAARGSTLCRAGADDTEFTVVFSDFDDTNSSYVVAGYISGKWWRSSNLATWLVASHAMARHPPAPILCPPRRRLTVPPAATHPE